MPQTVTVAAFIFGAILVLIALLGGGFELFGAKIAGTVGKPGRIAAGVLGGVLMIIGLLNPFQISGPPSITGSSTVTTSSTQPAADLVVTSSATSSIAVLATPTVTVSPMQAPTTTLAPTNPPTLTPTPTPICEPGCVLYQADWSKGMNGWAVSSDWRTVGGMMVSTGSNSLGVATAPYKPAITDYAVEAELQMVSIPSSGTVGFGLMARTGYRAGIGYWPANANIRAGEDIFSQGIGKGKEYDPSGDWHTYRLEVRANTVKLFIDGAQYAEAIDNTYIDAGEIGVWSMLMQINVRSFKVIKL